MKTALIPRLSRLFPADRATLQTLLMLILALLTVSVAHCVTADNAHPGYVIGSDDVLDVAVTNHEDLNRTVTVLQDGKITFPEIGEIEAAGKTPAELASSIKTGLEKTRKRVSVLVTIKEAHSQRVRVLGGVTASGTYELKRNWRVMDLIVAAGGLSRKSSHTSGRLIRHGSEVLPLDVEQAVSRPDSPANLLLERDDLMLLEEQEAAHFQVSVMGQVGKMGSYELDNDTTVLSLLFRAGNPSDRAALSRAYVLRGNVQLPLDLRAAFQGKFDPAIANFKFRPGDVFYLPEVTTRIAVFGQVARPGYLPLPESGDLTVVDALNLAGGAANGNIARAGILRKIADKPTVIPINIDRMLKTGNLSANVRLQADDILYIPSKSNRRFNWADVLTPLSVLSFFGVRL